MSSKPALAANPANINFQGKVVNANGTNVTNGTYSFIFRIYNAASPVTTTSCTSTASCLWEETQASVTVTNGVFQVELGASCALTSGSCNNTAGGPISANWSSSSLYLTMQFNGDAAGFMSPTIHLTSVPFAFNADNLGGIAASGFIQNRTTVQAANFFVQSANSGNIAGIVEGAASQSVDILDVNANAVANPLFSVGSAGASTFRNSANSTTAFQIQNAAGSSLLGIDTTDTNLITNPGFEVDASSWTASSTNTPSRSTSDQYLGLGSGTISATAANDGYKQTLATTLSPTTTYTLSFYAKQISGTAFADLAAAYDYNSTPGNEAACSNFSSTAVTTAGWTRYSCQFTTGSAGTAPTNTNYIIIKQTALNTRVWNIDAVQLETGTMATAYNTGAISLDSTIISPLTIQNAQNSSTGFQVNNASGLQLFGIDTSAGNANNMVTNPSFETGTAGWAGKNTATISQTSVFTTGGATILPQDGNMVLKVTTNTTAKSDGAKFPLTMVNGTSYTLTMYVKADVGFVSTFEIGRSDDGGTTDTSCLTAQKASNLSWTRLTCSFIAGAQSGSPYVYARQTDNATTARTFYVDAVLVQTDVNADSNYRNGKISLQGTVISSSVQIQTTVNTTTAFQLQNASGAQIFNISTTDNNLINNPGFEVNTTGWTMINGATVLQRDTTNTYAGVASGKFTTTVTANSGVRYTFGSALPSTAYVLSFYAQTNSADATINAGFNNGSDTTCTGIAPTTTPAGGGWTRFSCTIPTNIVNSIFITSGTTAITTFNLDSVQLELGATASSYGLGVISLNGIINSPATFQSLSNSTTAFQIQNSSGSNAFGVDTLNNRITLGNGAATAATVLVLGNKTDAGDPGTCTLGAIYYNSSAANADTAFRACRNVRNQVAATNTSTWVNLIAGVDIQDFNVAGTPTWTAPSGISVVMVLVCGGGGSGGGGQSGVAGGSIRTGGGGGGGGARVEKILTAADAGVSQTVTVGASVAGGGAAGAGNPGNPSSFGSIIKAYGGGGGRAGQTGAIAGGGGGGGIGSIGGNGTATTAVGGDTLAVTTTNGSQGWAGGYGNSTVGGPAEYGGAGGGGTNAAGTAASNGGVALFGGGGGAGGAGTTAANANTVGAVGGASGTGVYNNTGGGGGTAGATTGGAAGAGNNGTSNNCGLGGGGGGSNGAVGTGGTGGNGGNAGGGGGGGGGGVTGGAGGSGGRGEVWVISW